MERDERRDEPREYPDPAERWETLHHDERENERAYNDYLKTEE